MRSSGVSGLLIFPGHPQNEIFRKEYEEAILPQSSVDGAPNASMCPQALGGVIRTSPEQATGFALTWLTVGHAVRIAGG
jgi:hypothetical protein